MENRILNEKQKLPVRRIQSSDLPVMLKDLDLDEMKSYLVARSADLAGFRKLG